MQKDIYIGQAKWPETAGEVQGEAIRIGDEDFYVIRNVDRMDPFFMTIVSSSDHWMFISSNGGLTAGRKNAENALFPYYSDDKITQSADFVGSKTILRVHGDDRVSLWAPFFGNNLYATTRNLYKNQFGSRIIFEEINLDLALTFRYSWQFSEEFGFVKKSELINDGNEDREIEILDGLRNLVPYGVGTAIQNTTSNLVNGYKRNLLAKNGIGVFTLSAMIVDRAEPSEALKATTVWCLGLEDTTRLLSENQVEKFKRTGEVTEEKDVKGTPGSYYISSSIRLSPAQEVDWFMVAEVNQDRAAVEDLAGMLAGDKIEIINRLKEDVGRTEQTLRILVAKSDGLQVSGDSMGTGRHVSNVMFNIMRGGIFEEDYQVEVQDFLEYLIGINRNVFEKHVLFLGTGSVVSYQDLISKSIKTGDADLIRICYEYLPLTFSRRHGDPSRPWNKFNIDLKYDDGAKKRSYEGNWRDIFQNWEALAYSYPDYAMGMIFKFLNATTIDGYNPYRITRQGIDWETIEPDDPWSYIGYWGDHQIIYLQKLLECAHRHNPESLRKWLHEEVFVYANVPYEIKGYQDIVNNPKDTVVFNHEKENMILDRVSRIGADGKFVMDDDELTRATMMEKLLVTLLAKLSNFVPEGGIWLTTQRPEWNDANNALVGNGVSMVTLYYMRRYCQFFRSVILEHEDEYELHEEVAEMIWSIDGAMIGAGESLENGWDDNVRKRFTDTVGHCGETYRMKAYQGFSGETMLAQTADLRDFIDRVLLYIDQSIQANKREDGLYHAYNLIEFDGDELKVDHLYEMLEGQVAVLSSGYLSDDECLDVLDALKASKMYREDQYSYFLYPNRDIAHFLSKNQIPSGFAGRSPVIEKLKSSGDKHLIKFDGQGNCYFQGDIHNAADVRARLDSLSDSFEFSDKECQDVLDVFEEMFDHKSFTGRSGTFFAFEGLGSIYWHMVSKLLYAVQENIYWHHDQLSVEARGRLIQHYYEIRAGIGINKTPDLYGAFPTDPYSHTPLHRGAQQPGMTGQVKEDVLNRWAELGVEVKNSQITFRPRFLSPEEFLRESRIFEYFSLEGKWEPIRVETGQLAFTYCQVPVIYELHGGDDIEVQMDKGSSTISGLTLSMEISQEIFARSGKVRSLKVGLRF